MSLRSLRVGPTIERYAVYEVRSDGGGFVQQAVAVGPRAGRLTFAADPREGYELHREGDWVGTVGAEIGDRVLYLPDGVRTAHRYRFEINRLQERGGQPLPDGAPIDEEIIAGLAAIEEIDAPDPAALVPPRADAPALRLTFHEEGVRVAAGSVDDYALLLAHSVGSLRTRLTPLCAQLGPQFGIVGAVLDGYLLAAPRRFAIRRALSVTYVGEETPVALEANEGREIAALFCGLPESGGLWQLAARSD